MPLRNYTLTPQNRSKFQQLYLLNRMGMGETFPILLPGELGLLSPLLSELVGNDLVALVSQRYAMTVAGQEVLAKFRQRYRDYLQMYDCFCAVDLGVGEFAFASILSMTIDQFKIFLTQPRWEDLRVAVAAYKGLDPVEVVFMSFLNEGRFDHEGTKTGWCLDLLGDVVWDKILDICRTALHADDLGSSDVVDDIITQGSQLMVNLLESTKETAVAVVDTPVPQQPEREVITTTETITTVEEVTSYSVIGGGYYYAYDPYYLTSPMYVAPVWYEPYWVY